MLRTTVGQLLINDVLPEDLRDYGRQLDKKSIRVLMRELAERHPERYNDVASALMRLGAETATLYGGEASISLDDLKIGDKTRAVRDKLKQLVAGVLRDPNLTQESKDDKIVRLVSSHMGKLSDLNYDEQLAKRNAMAMQVASGARGNRSQFTSNLVGDLLVADHRDKTIPVPIVNSYSEGLDPVEYWAGSYGARKGYVDVKFATPKGGFLGKQLALAAHRLVVTEDDCGTEQGIPVDGNDEDNEGAILARDTDGEASGTIITPKHIKKFGDKKILVRSPMTCQAKNGVCSRCAGVREKGRLPEIGENVGVAAAQSISEPVSQSALSSKHSGGVVGAGPTQGGFNAINQLVQVPKTFKGGATVAQADGRVEMITDAPQGGKYVVIGGKQHWISPDLQPQVKAGDKVEAGDVISEGLPNPADIVRHKGVGAGRWHFVKVFRDTLNNSNVSAHRRNIEMLTRGLINHARITDPDTGEFLPDDLIEFDSLTRGYTPRIGTKTLAPKRAVGRYLERPYLQYSIGTRITPRVAKELESFGVKDVRAHDDEPGFQPEMVRAMETLSGADDWMVRLGGFHLKKNLLESVHRGRGSREHQTSYIPALAKGTEFGKPGPGAKTPY
jgi:DNA-directed RNA polymerase subunit beta'